MGLAPYASDPFLSRGRLFLEETSEERSPFQRDKDRILHSYAFRRLKHKTQVFIASAGEYYRTRLTHSLEVSQIARSMARALELNEDLAEAISLAHDLGHGPFGHAGENVINQALKEEGGFNHNDQTFRIITQLERKYASFDGLNLTWETLEGIVKHNGPIIGGLNAHPPYITIFSHLSQQDLELETYPSAEAQISAIADDIAYNTHDIDDGLRAGVFTLEEIRKLPLIKEILTSLEKTFPNIEQVRLTHETIRRLVNTFVKDAVSQAQEIINKLQPQSVKQIRALNHPIIRLSSSMTEHLTLIRDFLSKNMYRHPRVNQETEKAKIVIQRLFHHFLEQPEDVFIQNSFPSALTPQAQLSAKRQIADAIACLTDQEALYKYKKLISEKVL